MVLATLQVPWRTTYLKNSRARAYFTFNRCWWRLFGQVFCRHFFFSSSLSLLETARDRLKYCLKRAVKPKTTNQPNPQAIMVMSLYIYSNIFARMILGQHFLLQSSHSPSSNYLYIFLFALPVDKLLFAVVNKICLNLVFSFGVLN